MIQRGASEAAARGILLEPYPAEDHGQIGVVESSIGKVKTDVRMLLTQPFRSGWGFCSESMGLW